MPNIQPVSKSFIALKQKSYEFSVTGLCGENSSCRVIVRGDQSFHELHAGLYKALNFQLNHAYEFVFRPSPRHKYDNPGTVMFIDPGVFQGMSEHSLSFPEISKGQITARGILMVDSATALIGEVGIGRGRSFYYQYDRERFIYRLKTTRIGRTIPEIVYPQVTEIIIDHQERESEYICFNLENGKTEPLSFAGPPIITESRPLSNKGLLKEWPKRQKALLEQSI
jgi:hypothetical protein